MISRDMFFRGVRVLGKGAERESRKNVGRSCREMSLDVVSKLHSRVRKMSGMPSLRIETCSYD